MAAEVEKALAGVAQAARDRSGEASPSSSWSSGVNGSGKTTTIGKLAAKFRAEGRKP